MMRAFAAIATAPESNAALVSRSIEHARSMGLSICLQTERVTVLVSPDLPVQPCHEGCGIIIGDFFHRNQPTYAPVPRGAASELKSKLLIDGETRDGFWGDYIAIHVTEGGSVQFLHSPCGSINLYYLACDGSLFIASDSKILLMLAKRRRLLNWAAVAHNLVWDDLSSSETCIHDVHEIRCGEMGEWHDGSVSIEIVWNPWLYTEAEDSIWISDEAVELVRYELLRTIGARQAGGDRLAIDLSGGLDSSIIAAVCAVSGIEAACINLYDPDTEGDERQFARCVADHLHFELVEVIPRAAQVDLDKCARGHLPRPYVRSFVQAIDHCTSQAALEFGATAFFNGGGGDSVFCHLQSSGPVVDVLQSRGRSPNAIRIAHEVSRAARCSFWEVVRKAGQKAVRRSRHDRLIPDDLFLSAECRAIAETVPQHLPQPRERPLPGKIEQVHGIFRALYNLNGFSRSDHMKGMFPLLSQPLVEACLRIPTWLSVGEGRNRLIARRAMEAELPPMAVQRISKGGLGRLQRNIVRTQREQLRAKLLDGQLASQGLIDRSAVECELKDEASYRTESVYRLMRLCDVETWCSA